MSRKYEAIDLIKLYSLADTVTWNAFLTRCHEAHDISTLTRTRYQLQAGMDDLAKRKLNSEKMIIWFLRLQTSLEKTIKKIVREKNPNPCDDPLIAVQFSEFKDAKKDRDHDLELFLKKSGY
jgi:hypothetical protein